ncbi:MAG: hypothetical protein IKX89_06530 [Firmicutes bacterium]|nr:hypothetical protein [Bacillota bacterium]
MKKHLRFFRIAAALLASMLMMSAAAPAYASGDREAWESEVNTKRLITAAVCAVCAAAGSAVLKIKESKEGDDRNEESDSTDTGPDTAA